MGGWGDEFDGVGLANDFAYVLGLEVLLTDVAGFIVEEAVRVTHPSDASEKNSVKKKDNNNTDRYKTKRRVMKWRNGAKVVDLLPAS